MSLKDKAVKGVSWSLVERIGMQGIKFILGIILARLLTPEDFGLVGMVAVFFAIAQVFIDSGFGHAYIQKEEVSDNDANTVFYTNFSISLLLYGLLWLFAPAIAKFYDQPQLTELTRVMGVVIIINSFSIIQIAQLTRDVNFKRKTKILLIAVIISGVLGVSAAYYGLGVWSLVIQQLTNRFFMVVGFWITSKWKPSLNFSFASFRQMFSFGGWLLLSGIITKIFENIYILTIGKFFPAAQVGFYTKSKDIRRLTSKEIGQAIGFVAFPVLSKLQDNKEDLQRGMRKFLTHSMVFMMPILITVIVVSEPFVIILLKEKWAPMIPYLQLLCFAGLLYPIHSVNIQALKAQGKSNLTFRLNLIKNSLRIINIIISYRWGVLYIIIGEVIISILSIYINTYYTNKLINYGPLKQLRDIWKIVLGGLLAGALGLFINLQLENLWVMLFVGGFVSFGVYAAFQYLFNRKFFMEVIDLRETFKKR
jgi:O-antigen/teichoic acid export membrane protein